MTIIKKDSTDPFRRHRRTRPQHFRLSYTAGGIDKGRPCMAPAVVSIIPQHEETGVKRNHLHVAGWIEAIIRKSCRFSCFYSINQKLPVQCVGGRIGIRGPGTPPHDKHPLSDSICSLNLRIFRESRLGQAMRHPHILRKDLAGQERGRRHCEKEQEKRKNVACR